SPPLCGGTLRRKAYRLLTGLISFEQRFDIGALGLDRLEERHVLPGRSAVDDRREGDPAAIALANVAGDPAHGSWVVQGAGLQRHAVEPRRAALADRKSTRLNS